MVTVTPDSEAEVKDSQYKFWLRMVSEREERADDPFWFLWSLVKSEKAHLVRGICLQCWKVTAVYHHKPYLN